MPEDQTFKPNAALMQDDELLRLTSIFVQLGFQKIRLTGGEPTIRANIVELVDRIAKLDGLRSLSMTTNGVLLRKLAAPLTRALPYLKAEIIYAVTSEGAHSVCDVLERRTRIWFEAENFGEDLAPAVADLIAPYLGWKATQKRKSVADYLNKVEAAKDSVANLAR